MDSTYNNPRNANYSSHIYKSVLLKDVVTSFSGGTPSKGEPRFWNGNIPWASPKDFDDFYLQDTQDHISWKGFEAARLKLAPKGSVLVVVRSGILKHTLPVAVTENQMAINQDIKALVPRDDVDPYYLGFCLNVFGDSLLPIISKHSTTVQSINTAQFDVLSIPLPSLETQAELVAEMQEAQTQRRRKLKQADEILSGLDAYLLEQLGVEVQTTQRQVFAVRVNSVRSRADVAFHTPKAQHIRDGLERSLYPSRTIRSLCTSIKTGFAAGRQDQASDAILGVPHLRPLNLSIYGELTLEDTKFVPAATVSEEDYCQVGEVLFNNTNSEALVGKSAVFDLNTLCVCSNHMTRLALTKKAHPFFITALFNALRSTGYFGILATNFNNQAGINIETLGALKIPVPQIDIQRQIASDLSSRFKRALTLRAEAAMEWEAAKARFEQQLLGDS